MRTCRAGRASAAFLSPVGYESASLVPMPSNDYRVCRAVDTLTDKSICHEVISGNFFAKRGWHSCFVSWFPGASVLPGHIASRASLTEPGMWQVGQYMIACPGFLPQIETLSNDVTAGRIGMSLSIVVFVLRAPDQTA